MSFLDQLVNVQITANTVSPTRQGFGTPLIMAYHTLYPDLARSYTGTAGMLTDGFTANSPAYKAAAVMLAQNPTVSTFYIGRRQAPPLQTLHLTCQSAVAGQLYSVTVVGYDGMSHLVTLVSTGVPNTDCATLATALGLLTNIGVVTHSGAVITLTQTAGNMIDLQGWALGSTAPFYLTDVTTDPGITTDLNAVYAAFPTAWYGLALDSNSQAECEAAAAWTETNKKLFFCNNSDSGNAIAAVTSDLFTALKTSGYTRTLPVFAGSQLLSYTGCAAFGKVLPKPPGSWTLAYKTLAGVPADNLSSSQFTALCNLAGTGGGVGKEANAYTTVGGLNVLFNGISPAGEYVDLVQFIDWLQANIQADVFGVLAGNDKVPYTDPGIDQIVSAIKTDLKAGVRAGGLVAGSWGVTQPVAADVDQNDRDNRNVPGISFTGRLAGAIHTLQITGTVTP